MTWPRGRNPAEGPPLASVEASGNGLRAAPGTYPVPDGRGRWRLLLYWRPYSANVTFQSQLIAELTDARSRNLQQQWNQPAQLSFTINGRSPAATLIQEMTQEVIAWRWDDQTGKDVAVFRGPITQANDQLTEQSYTINFTCHDYLAMLDRRFVTRPITWHGMDQDSMGYNFVNRAIGPTSSVQPGTSLTPAGWLPIARVLVNPAGAARAASGVLRDRAYPEQTKLSEALANLAAVDGGFDFDILPGTGSSDSLRVFYPYQGVLRTSPILAYGSTVAGLSRTVNSGDFANYVRVLGQQPDDSTQPQVYSETWDPTTALPGNQGSIGLWMFGDQASDVSIQSTLDEKARGDLNQMALLQPSYSLSLRRDAYSWGNPNMGDVVPLIVQVGRLNVNSSVRVVGITYDIGDDGQEDVSLTVGRPDVNFVDLFTRADRNVDALARR